MSGPSPISRTSPTWGNSWKMSWSQVRSALAALVPSGFLEKESQKTIVKLLVELCESDPWHIWNYLDTCWKILDSSFFQTCQRWSYPSGFQDFRAFPSRQRSKNQHPSCRRPALLKHLARRCFPGNWTFEHLSQRGSPGFPRYTLPYLVIPCHSHAQEALMEKHQPFVAYIIHGYSILES